MDHELLKWNRVSELRKSGGCLKNTLILKQCCSIATPREIYSLFKEVMVPWGEFISSHDCDLKTFQSINEILCFVFQGNSFVFWTLIPSFSTSLWWNDPKTKIRYSRTPANVPRSQNRSKHHSPLTYRELRNLLTELFYTFLPTLQWGFIIWRSFQGHRCRFSASFNAKAGLSITLWYDRVAYMLLPSSYLQQ